MTKAEIKARAAAKKAAAEKAAAEKAAADLAAGKVKKTINRVGSGLDKEKLFEMRVNLYGGQKALLGKYLYTAASMCKSDKKCEVMPQIGNKYKENIKAAGGARSAGMYIFDSLLKFTVLDGEVNSVGKFFTVDAEAKPAADATDAQRAQAIAIARGYDSLLEAARKAKEDVKDKKMSKAVEAFVIEGAAYNALLAREKGASNGTAKSSKSKEKKKEELTAMEAKYNF